MLKYCGGCKEEKAIIKIERDEQGETFLLSCGHRIIEDIVSDTVNCEDYIYAKQHDALRRLQSRYETKKSGETKRPAIDNLEIDRGRGIKVHQVWEEEPGGKVKLVHNEQVPLKKKKVAVKSGR